MTPRASLGDPLPAALLEYWEALDAGRFREAASCFGVDALYAAPVPGGVETGPRSITRGAAALVDRFVERGRQPWSHAPVLCVVDGSDALVEGVLHDESGDAVSTYVCSARIGEHGRVDRFLAFACRGARDPIPTDVDVATEPADAAEVVHAYFTDLDDGNFAGAADHFSEDVLYSHPPYRHTGIVDPDRVEFRGRRALRAAFDTRGKASFGHEVLTSIQRGPHCIFEGAVHDLPNGGTGSFISSLSLAADGTIRRYVSFYCEPGIG